jgi:DtxR family Mn-dependent transcriptional regulator
VENRPLTECEVGFPFRLARVVDQSPDFLRFLSESGLGLGASGKVTANHAAAGVVSISIDGHETTLGREVAGKLLVASEVAAAD